jgi:hypothetical protein
MCPFCLATMGLFVAGAVSTGGVAALAAKVSRKKKEEREVVLNSNKENEDVNEHD